MLATPDQGQKLTLETYLAYEVGTDTLYELIDGELAPVALGSGQHGAVIKLLERVFDLEIERLQKDWIALSQGTIGIQSPRGGRWDTARIPDVVVMQKEQWQGLQDREALIRLNESPPLLVVEVVSASTQKTDYRSKRAESCVLNILEYWIVDPLSVKVTVLTLTDGWYEEQDFVGTDKIHSQVFPDLSLTTAELLP
ncbi:MAG: Uma2 family endonuclease [Thermosynechococcaceae cyanobacterium]